MNELNQTELQLYEFCELYSYTLCYIHLHKDLHPKLQYTKHIIFANTTHKLVKKRIGNFVNLIY